MKGEGSGRITRLFQHSAVYAVSAAVQRLTGLLMLPVYTNFAYLASRSAFGDYALVFTFIAFMNFFYLYGMDSAFLRFFFLADRDRRTVFSSTYLILSLTSLLTTALVIGFSEPIASALLKSPTYAEFIRLAGLILLFDTLTNLPYLVLRAEERPVSFVLFRTGRFLLELALNLVFVVFLKKGVLGILYANLLAAVINWLAMLPVVARYFHWRIDLALWKEMVRFGLPFLPNGIAFMTIETIDRVLVQEFLGKDAVGLYSPNYKFGTILLLLVVAFRNAWQPFFLKIAGQRSQQEAKQTYARVFYYYLIAAGLVTLGATFTLDYILKWRLFDNFYLLGPAYWPGIPIIPVILLSYFCFGIYVIFTPGFYIQKRSGLMIWFTGTGALLNVLVNVWLLPRIGIWGAALATLASYASMAVLIFLVAQRIYPIPLQAGRILKSLFPLLLGVALYYLQPLNLFARLAILVVICLWYYWRCLTPEERRLSLRLLQAVKS
ncbi:MAG: hypothetical protein D6715_03355 [Calditrichaeota bacterium]|nr:MAG: hypothetical protein D6715_03355 [Calditrichota bacterium]